MADLLPGSLLFPNSCPEGDPNFGISCGNTTLASPSGLFELVMQQDGNLVIYSKEFNTTIWIWASWTQGNPGAFLWMQDDGNLVIYVFVAPPVFPPPPPGVVYAGYDVPIWASWTQGNPGAFLRMQDDGNLVIYSKDGIALWNSGTAGWHPSYPNPTSPYPGPYPPGYPGYHPYSNLVHLDPRLPWRIPPEARRRKP